MILKMTDTGREHPIVVQVERVEVRDDKSALQSDRCSIACGQHFKIFKSLSHSVPRPNVICPWKSYVSARCDWPIRGPQHSLPGGILTPIIFYFILK